MGGKRGGVDSCEHTKALNLKPCDPGFRLKSVLLGERGANVHHIEDAAGAKVRISEDRIEIGADSKDDLAKADAMVKDLVKASYERYAEWQKEEGGGRGKGRGRDRRDEDD